jgi:hypothetical protein
MAGTLALNVEILGEFQKLTKATKGAEGSLQGLNKTAAGISAGFNKALGAIGVGFSLNFLKNELEQASKAAIEDVKSQELLSIAMINTGKATEATVKQAEDSIKKMQLQSAVADDLLRPAFQKLFISTNSVTESNRLLQIALDTSAATGKDLDTVTQAMAKSLEGSDTALNKLVPSLAGVEDPMSQLEATFKGAAEAAADLDPYQRMNIVFGEIQEQIGMALLPLLQDFSAWLATPEGQEKLQGVVDGIVDIIENLVELVAWVDENQDWLVPMVVAIGTVTTAWNVATAAVNGFKAAAGLAAIAGVSTAVGAGTVGTLGIAGAGAAVGGFMQGETLGQQSRIYAGSGFQQGGGLFGNAFQSPSVTNNISVKTDATAQEIADAINKANRASGTNLIRAR